MFMFFYQVNYVWVNYRMGLAVTWSPIVYSVFKSHYVINSAIEY